MSTTTIGIKVADRTYYPVLDRGAAGRKRLVLTTVKDEQTSVQIDLYENAGTKMDTAQYVGSLLIENIDAAQSGEAEVELVLGLDDAQNLGASASEATSGERQSLSVSLESLSNDSVFDIPEFELDDDLDTWDESDQTFDTNFESTFSADDPDGQEDTYEGVGVAEQEAIVEKKRPLMFGLFIVFGIALIVLIVLLLIKIIDGPSVPPLEARGDGTNVEQVADRSASNEVAGGGPAIAPTEDQERAASMYMEPENIDTLGGTWYWIRRGDTLWTLSYSFYQNPRLFVDIASQNNIVNPDMIFAGDRIYIPPR